MVLGVNHLVGIQRERERGERETNLTVLYDAKLGEVAGDFGSVDVGPVVVEFGFRELGVAVGEDCEFDELLFLFGWVVGWVSSSGRHVRVAQGLRQCREPRKLPCVRVSSRERNGCVSKERFHSLW